MKIHNEIQGSPEWKELRASYFTASEAPAAAGVHKYGTSRSDLLKQKKTGDTPEVSSYQQKIFDAGHKAEAFARELAEEIVGEDLYPVTGSVDIDGLNLLASFDGLTMNNDIVWEHKLYSAPLAEAVRTGALEPHYIKQLDQQLLVSGAKKALFMTSDGTKENMAYMWYEPAEHFDTAIVDMWHQFSIDLEDYEVKPEVVEPKGKIIEELPALAVQIEGGVKSSNLATFKDSVLALIQSIKTDLVTDDDFADAENVVKFCKKAEKDIDQAKKSAQAQAADIDALFRTMDTIKAELGQTRITLDKKVKAEKANRKEILVSDGFEQINAAHAAAMAELSHEPDTPTPDLRAAIKGKRSLSSMQDAIDDAIAKWKVQFQKDCAKVARNEKALNEAGDYKFLFNDAADYINKDEEYVEMLVKTRISEHEEKLKAEAEAAAEAERQKIRAEEEAKAKAEAEAKLAMELEKQREQEAENQTNQQNTGLDTEQNADARTDVVHEQNEQETQTDVHNTSDESPSTPEAETAKDPIRETNWVAKEAFVAAGLNEELAKTIIKLVAMNKIPGVAMIYPEAKKEAA